MARPALQRQEAGGQPQDSIVGRRRLSGELVAAILWTAFVLLILLLPGDSISTLGPGFGVSLPDGTDKGVHAVAFYLETLFLDRALRRSRGPRSLRTTVPWTSALAGATELLQLGVPGRSCDVADFAADLVGIACCAAVVIWAGRERSLVPGN